MTARRYERASPERVLADHGERLEAVEFGNPLPTFRATITADVGTVLREYEDLRVGIGMDTVFWDYWDPTYDPRFFDPIVASSGIDVGRLGAVELLVPGLYGIRASIDWDDFFNGDTYLGSNYDDGSIEHWYMNATDDIPRTFALDQFRIFWPAYTGAENMIEIIAGHTDPGAFHTIPGGFNGAWAMPPHLVIAYLGGLGTEPNYIQDQNL